MVRNHDPGQISDLIPNPPLHRIWAMSRLNIAARIQSPALRSGISACFRHAGHMNADSYGNRMRRPRIMARIMRKPLRLVVLTGLVLGASLGMAGTLVSSAVLRAELWAIDGTALVVSTVVLALFFFRQGCDGVAAGFLVYAIGEAVMLGGTANPLAASVPAFAAGAALWAAGLALASWPPVMPLWSRVTGAFASILFGLTSLRIFAGALLTPLSKPFPYFAYPFLVLTFAGWFWKTFKASEREQRS